MKHSIEARHMTFAGAVLTFALYNWFSYSLVAISVALSLNFLVTLILAATAITGSNSNKSNHYAEAALVFFASNLLLQSHFLGSETNYHAGWAVLLTLFGVICSGASWFAFEVSDESEESVSLPNSTFKRLA